MFEASDYKVRSGELLGETRYWIEDTAYGVTVDPIWMFKEHNPNDTGFVINVPEAFQHVIKPNEKSEFVFFPGKGSQTTFLKRKDALLFRLWLVHDAGECIPRCQFCAEEENEQKRQDVIDDQDAQATAVLKAAQ
jgi:hypothetical protein